MPIPKPKKGETFDKFAKRAIPFLIKEGKKQSQAAAIAASIWDRNKKGD